MHVRMGISTFKTSSVSISNDNIKTPIEKSIFAFNLPLKFFPATVANANIGSLKVFPYIPQKMFVHMLMKFEQNRIVQTTRNFELFDKNLFLNHFDKALTPFWKTFL